MIGYRIPPQTQALPRQMLRQLASKTEALSETKRGQGIQKLHWAVRSNEFKINRSLDTYCKTFGDTFAKSLMNLKPKDTWLDGGAGAAIAQYDYIRSFDQPAKVIAVSPIRPLISPLDPHCDLPYSRYMEETVENLPISDLRPVKLITDLHGAIAYTPNLYQVMEKYIDLLPLEGKLFFIATRTSIEDTDGKRISVHDWLLDMDGVRVFPLRSDVEKLHPEDKILFGLEKESHFIKIPQIEFQETKDTRGFPLERVFKKVAAPKPPSPPSSFFF